ncbi:hypothetical protein HK102_000948 [Quaeritorhiza haematococci]|nr:hypothetical protein HK102_000948 [Quaeritorhiza haematococci]
MESKPVWIFTGFYGLCTSLITTALYYFVSKKLFEVKTAIRLQQKREAESETRYAKEAPTTTDVLELGTGTATSGNSGDTTIVPKYSHSKFDDVTWKLMAYTGVIMVTTFPVFCHAIAIYIFIAIFDNSSGLLNFAVYLAFYRSKPKSTLPRA